MALGSLICLFVIAKTSTLGYGIVKNIPFNFETGLAGLPSNSFLVPVVLFLYELMLINVVLGIFNLIPVPPLDFCKRIITSF